MYSITPCDAMYGAIADVFAVVSAFNECARCVDMAAKELTESVDNIMYCMETCDRCVGGV